MKKNLMLAGCAVLLLLWSSLVAAAVTTSPSSLTIARGTQTIRTVQYRFNVIKPDPSQSCFPGRGVHQRSGTILGRVPRTLIPLSCAKIQAARCIGRGTVSEQLVISETILQRAQRLGISRFQYRREPLPSTCRRGCKQPRFKLPSPPPAAVPCKSPASGCISTTTSATSPSNVTRPISPFVRTSNTPAPAFCGPTGWWTGGFWPMSTNT